MQASKNKHYHMKGTQNYQFVALIGQLNVTQTSIKVTKIFSSTTACFNS